MKPSKQIRTVGIIVATILMLVGLYYLAEGDNYQYIENTSFFGDDVVDDYLSLGFGDHHREGLELIQSKGNKAVWGIVFMLLSIATVTVSVLISNSQKTFEKLADTPPLTQPALSGQHDIRLKLQQLESIKQDGLITEEEYQKKREEIISSL